MDLSALIFVALAVAWAVYLIPKALRHHEEDAVSRSVDSFSDRMRVLARRDAVSADRAELVVGGKKPTPAEPVVEVEPEPAPAPVAPAPVQGRVGHTAAARAAARRRRVLGLVLIINLAYVVLASASVVPWAFIAGPVGLLVGWLVACRLMVRSERAARVRKRRRTLADVVIDEEDAAVEEQVADNTSESAVAQAGIADPESTPGGWDPVPMTLPTYVAKAPAGRTVRTIDLDSTGVWSSGRNAADSQLARDAQATSREVATDAEKRRASGA